MQPEPFQTRPQLRIQQNIEHGPRDLLPRTGVEQNAGGVGHFGHRRQPRAGHGPPARHGFEDRQTEAFVERRKHEQIARAVELHQVGVFHKSGKMHAVPKGRPVHRPMQFVGVPGFLADEHQIVGQLR